MNNQTKHWEILGKKKAISSDEIIKALLSNRNIKDPKKFFDPIHPSKISLTSLGVKEKEIKKAVERIKKTKKNKENIIIYGDYDADGITATAIMWEALHALGLDVLPFIPDRFIDGYGIKADVIKNLKDKDKNLGLIITVDNGIVGYEGVDAAGSLGIDVIIVDHHTKGEKKLKAHSVIHSTETSGSGLSWLFAKELGSVSGLELAAIGTIADQLPLTGINRSIVKYGLEELNKTKRLGLLALFKESGMSKEVGTVSVGTYEVGYIIAPRINAMGRLKHGLESLRLLCTNDSDKAFEIAKNIGSTNIERQKIVEEVVIAARKNVGDQKIIVIGGKDYHEGVIGLAAGRLVEEFYRPAIVLSTKGEISKASARSISGFNIIEAIRAVSLHLEGGGHSMAAGFSIETAKIDQFTKEINKFAAKLLMGGLLERKLKIDLEINFNQINYGLYEELERFAPTGLGNPIPTFMTKAVDLVEIKAVGREARHLKLKLRGNGQVLDSIYFGGGEIYSNLTTGTKIDIVYQIDDNTWNGYSNLQLKVKDLKVI